MRIHRTAAPGRQSNTASHNDDSTSAGRKKTESLTIFGQTYQTDLGYNSRGELIRYDYPDGAIVQREYTDRGELHKIKHDSTVIDTRGYDDGGRMTSSSYNNGVSESRGYNTDNTLASITFSGASIGNMTYSWDSNKNKTAEEITGTMSDYGFTIPSGGYDEEDRLVSYNRTAGLTQSWDLSLVGDWNSVTTNSNTQNRTHGPAHEILTVASQNVIHEYKGNTTLIPAAARGNTLDLVVLWDFDNRMQLASEVQFGKPVISHKYDALGRRIARTQGTTTTVFVQVGQQTICDYPSGGTPAQSIYHYLYASYIDEPVMRWETAEEEAVYYHRNQQYSIVALTDDSGDIIERYSYTAYGDPAFFDGSGSQISESQISNRFTYTGREWDSVIKLYHYRARMYDPQLGRFLGRDPIGYLDGPNQFAFVRNRALKWVDPFGLQRIKREGERWEVPDFFNWYYYGQGDDIDISRIGLLIPWWQHVQPQIYFELSQSVVPFLTAQLDCTRGKTSLTVDVRSEDTRLGNNPQCPGAIHTLAGGGIGDPLTVMGNSCVKFRGTCKIEIRCVHCCGSGAVEIESSKGSCDFTFMVRDRFQNPLDVGGFFGQHDWPGAVPYDLYATWYHTWKFSEVYETCQTE